MSFSDEEYEEQRLTKKNKMKSTDSSEAESPKPAVTKEAKPKRVRISKACNQCSSRKVRCDGLLPSCSRCFSANMTCQYTRPTKKRGPAPGSVVSLQKRLKRLEELLERATTQGDVFQSKSQDEYLEELKEMQSNGTLGSLGKAAQGLAEKILVEAQQIKPKTRKDKPVETQPYTFPAASDIFQQIKQIQTQHMQGAQNVGYSAVNPDPLITMQLQQLQAMQQPNRFGAEVLDKLFGRGQYEDEEDDMDEFEEDAFAMTLQNNANNAAAAARAAAAAVQSVQPSFGFQVADAQLDETPSPHDFVDLASLGLQNPWGQMDQMSDLELIVSPGPDHMSSPMMKKEIEFEEFADLPPMPDAVLLDRLIELYFEVVPSMGLGIDFVHRKTFGRSNPPPILLYSMYAVAIPFLDSRTCVRFGITPDAQDKGKLAMTMFERAKRLLYKAMENPSIAVLQSLLNLVIFGVSSWTLGAIAYQFVGIAVTMTRQMKVNWEPFSERFERMLERATGSKPVRCMSPIDAETRRRIWWSLYNLDRCTAVAADRSCLISDTECLIALPCHQQAWESDGMDFSRPLLESVAPSRLAALSEEAVASSDVMAPHLSNLAQQWQSLNVDNLPACLAMVLSAGGEEVNVMSEMIPKLQQVRKISSVEEGIKLVEPNVAVYQAMLNNIVGKIVEFHQWCLFRDLNPFNPPATQLGDIARKKLGMVDDMLKRWWEMIPSEIKEYETENKQSKTTIPYLHLFYRTAIVLLHCPRDTNLMRLENDVSWLSGDSFLRCSEEATFIADLLENILKASPDLTRADPYASFCIFQTGLIHLVGIKNLQQQMILACGSPDCGADDLVELVNEAKRQLDFHICALRVLGKRWMTAHRLCQIISKLVEDVQAPLVTGFGLLVSEETDDGRFWTLRGLDNS